MTNTPDAGRADRIDFYTALEAARKAFKPIVKDRTAKIGDKFSYKYADLTSVLGAVTPALSENGLILNHSMRYQDNLCILQTELTHISTGFTKVEEYPIPISNDPQKFGSALTYGRRYSVCCLLNVVADDDDDGAIAKAASEEKLVQGKRGTTPITQANPETDNRPRVTNEERQAIVDFGTKLFGGDIKKPMKKMLATHGVEKIADLRQCGPPALPSDPDNIWQYLNGLSALKNEVS